MGKTAENMSDSEHENIDQNLGEIAMQWPARRLQTAF